MVFSLAVEGEREKLGKRVKSKFIFINKLL